MRRAMIGALVAVLAAACAPSQKQRVGRNDPTPALKAFRSVTVDAPGSQSEDDVTVSVRPVSQMERIQVVDPNSQERIRDSFSPYAHPGVVDTTVFVVSIANNGKTPVPVPDAGHVFVGLGADSRPALGWGQMARAWQDYAARVNNSSVSWPLSIEHERANKALTYIGTTILKGGEVPPGGRVTGYVPVDSGQLTPGGWTIRIPAIRGSKGSLPEFKFTVSVM